MSHPAEKESLNTDNSQRVGYDASPLTDDDALYVRFIAQMGFDPRHPEQREEALRQALKHMLDVVARAQESEETS